MSKLPAMTSSEQNPGNYRVDRATGTIEPAIQCPSPNHDDRPVGSEPELLIVHGISLPPGEYGGRKVEEFFCNRLDPTLHPYFEEIVDMRVSAHLLLERDGRLLQFVSFDNRAWHAGESTFRGRNCCNDFAIGIELEGTDETPYSDAQYAGLAGITLAICAAYPGIRPATIAGHCDVAPGRKSDPGPAFDWLRLYDGLQGMTKKP